MHRLTKLTGVCFILICFSKLCLNLNVPSRSTLLGIVYTESNLDDRDRRAPIDLAVKGLLASQRLLSGTRAIKSRSERWRKYEKHGDLQTAIKDYYSVEPAESAIMSLRLSTKHQKVGKVLSGTVGDRWVVLWMDGDRYSKGQPVLDIIDTVPKPGPGMDKIVYVPIVPY